jgi:hypothetical protein
VTKVKITIAGPTKSYKSTIALLIRSALMDLGATVTVDDTDPRWTHTCDGCLSATEVEITVALLTTISVP